MRGSEALTIMLYAARIDPRLGTPGEEDGRAWAPLLAGLDPRRCLAAVDKHYAGSTERIMPAHIRALARTVGDVADEPVEIEPLVTRTGRQVEPHAGEVLCPSCALIHRRDESCEEFARNRRSQLPRPIGATVKAITDAPESPSPARERALQRARAERGNVPWSPPREGPPEDGGAPREERDEVDVSPSVAVLASLRGAPARSCVVCAAGPSGAPVFMDVPEGRAAHRAVFGHDPRSSTPQQAEREPQPEGAGADAQ